MYYQDNFDWSTRKMGEDRLPPDSFGADIYSDRVNWLQDESLHRQPLSIDGDDPISWLERPRIFISRKKKDSDLAKRIAYLATRKGFNFWLDVLNPSIYKIHGHRVTPFQKKIILATIIEVGLMNCSHVIAVISKKLAALKMDSL